MTDYLLPIVSMITSIGASICAFHLGRDSVRREHHRTDDGSAAVAAAPTLGLAGILIAAAIALVLSVLLPSCDDGPRPNAGAPVFAEQQPAVLASAPAQEACDRWQQHAWQGQPWADQAEVEVMAARSGLPIDRALLAQRTHASDMAATEHVLDVCQQAGWAA